MKWIKLAEDDFMLFDQEVDVEQNEYMQSHVRVWEEMFLEQGQLFWLHFLISYRSFTLNYGFANNLDDVFFPLCKSKVKRLVDEACIAIHKEFIESDFKEVKKLFDDIVIVVKNRHLIPHLGSESPDDDPFYHEDTKNAYRYLFCESGNSTNAWKVAIGVPFFLKFAGALCNILRRWIREKTLSDKKLEEISKNSYWAVPTEWQDQDFKPGVFELYLLKFWDKKLAEVLGIDDIYEKFSNKLIHDPCYLEYDSLSCICDSNQTYGNDVYSCKCTRKVIHKSGGCRIRSDLLPSEITNSIAQAQKVNDTKERLRKKLGKKLRSKGENFIVSDDCVADSDWRLKLLEKAEKQFKKENKGAQKECKDLRSEEEKQGKISNKAKKSDVEESCETADEINVTCVSVSITARAVKDTGQKHSKVVKKVPEKIKANIKNNSDKGKTQTNDIQKKDAGKNSKKINSEKKDCKITATTSHGKDDLAKDLEDIGDNLDTIEKSIKEKGGLDLEEFKLLLETGRLLMKENKSVKAEADSTLQKTVAKLHVCAQCMSKETAPKMYKKCSRCKVEKFAVPRYYCSKKCQVEDWEESHRDEHLRASSHKV